MHIYILGCVYFSFKKIDFELKEFRDFF